MSDEYLHLKLVSARASPNTDVHLRFIRLSGLTSDRFVGFAIGYEESFVALSFLSYLRPFVCPRHLLRANGKRGYQNERDDLPRAILQPYPSILRFDGEWDPGYNGKPRFGAITPKTFRGRAALFMFADRVGIVVSTVSTMVM